jgi:hypothetical protein
MMNWYSQLTRLILSFYRENPLEKEQLRPLKFCKLSRRWGVLRINCRDQATADALIRAAALLREPVAQLRLAQRINILVKGNLITALPVDSPPINSWKL